MVLSYRHRWGILPWLDFCPCPKTCGHDLDCNPLIDASTGLKLAKFINSNQLTCVEETVSLEFSQSRVHHFLLNCDSRNEEEVLGFISVYPGGVPHTMVNPVVPDCRTKIGPRLQELSAHCLSNLELKTGVSPNHRTRWPRISHSETHQYLIGFVALGQLKTMIADTRQHFLKVPPWKCLKQSFELAGTLSLQQICPFCRCCKGEAAARRSPGGWVKKTTTKKAWVLLLIYSLNVLFDLVQNVQGIVTRELGHERCNHLLKDELFKWNLFARWRWKKNVIFVWTTILIVKGVANRWLLSFSTRVDTKNHLTSNRCHLVKVCHHFSDRNALRLVLSSFGDEMKRGVDLHAMPSIVEEVDTTSVQQLGKGWDLLPKPDTINVLSNITTGRLEKRTWIWPQQAVPTVFFSSIPSRRAEKQS